MVSASSSVCPERCRSASMSRSTSKGWARRRSASVAPCAPTARRPRSSMRSPTPLEGAERGVAPQLRRQGHELPAVRAHLAVEDLLDHGDGLGTRGYQARPAQVAADHAHHPVVELLLVEQDPLAVGQPPLEGRVQLGQDHGRVVVRAERHVGVHHPVLVVGVQVVGRRQQRHDPGEPLVAEPEDLLVAAHLAVVPGVAAGALADGQLAFDDPLEKPRRDARRPFAFHRTAPVAVGLCRRVCAPRPPCCCSLSPGWWFGRSWSTGAVPWASPAVGSGSGAASRRTIATGATSWTRTRAAPAAIAQAAVATDASSRSEGGGITPSRAVSRPRKLLRLAPTATGQPVATRRSRWRSRERLWAAVLANPRPGSIHTSATPAALACSARAVR